jgi:hypothetical protein
MDIIIQEILGDLYKPEKILTQSIAFNNESVKITYSFPPYERTIQSMNHVSMSQMHEAILEGLYCTIGLAIKNRTITVIDFQTFLEKRLDTIYYRENFFFRKMLKANNPADLIFSITDVSEKKLRKTFYSVTIQVSGFIRGETECLLEK